jgi:truncated hemoglobin YjbI
VGHPPVDICHDIETRADCERLVRSFYGRALTDPIIGWLFTDVAKLDLEAHVPRITNFWETILLDAHSYGGGAFRPHLELNSKTPLKRGHFDRWLHLWGQTVDELSPASARSSRRRTRPALRRLSRRACVPSTLADTNRQRAATSCR